MKKITTLLITLSMFLYSCEKESQLIIPIGWELSHVKIAQTCENSLIRYDGKIINLQGYDWFGDMWLGEFNESMSSYTVLKANWKTEHRLAYAVKYDGIYYVSYYKETGKINGLMAGDIYLDRFSDIENWEICNNGNPIITHIPGTIYTYTYNPIFYIENNEFVLYLEIGKEPDQSDVRMARIKYTWPGLVEISREDNVLWHMGNAFLERKNGHTYMIVGYHNYPERIINIRLVIDDVMQPESVFVIKEQGIHIGDATYIETATGSAIVFSYDQRESWTITSKNRLW